jgi:hypothetical protein
LARITVRGHTSTEMRSYLAFSAVTYKFMPLGMVNSCISSINSCIFSSYVSVLTLVRAVRTFPIKNLLTPKKWWASRAGAMNCAPTRLTPRDLHIYITQCGYMVLEGDAEAHAYVADAGADAQAVAK